VAVQHRDLHTAASSARGLPHRSRAGSCKWPSGCHTAGGSVRTGPTTAKSAQDPLVVNLVSASGNWTANKHTRWNLASRQTPARSMFCVLVILLRRHKLSCYPTCSSLLVIARSSIALASDADPMFVLCQLWDHWTGNGLAVRNVPLQPTTHWTTHPPSGRASTNRGADSAETSRANCG
jgi:hypothetical protein